MCLSSLLGCFDYKAARRGTPSKNTTHWGWFVTHLSDFHLTCLVYVA